MPRRVSSSNHRCSRQSRTSSTRHGRASHGRWPTSITFKSKETLKGHGHKTRSGLQSTKTTTESDNKDNNKNAKATHLPWPTIKQKEAIIKTYNLSDKAECLMYTNQTGKFPKKSSCSYQYIMILIEIDSNEILVEAMKDHSAGEMIRT